MALKCSPRAACTHTVDISVLEQEVPQLEVQLSAETQESFHCRHLHNSQHDPLCRIPTEIASAILCYANPLSFEYLCLNENPQAYFLPGVPTPTRPIKLAAVSRQWSLLRACRPCLSYAATRRPGISLLTLTLNGQPAPARCL